MPASSQLRMMKPIVQGDKTGCGFAAVAALAGVTYKEVRGMAERLGISAADSRLWSETAYVRRLLNDYGIRTSARRETFVSWDWLPPVAMLAIKWHRERGRPCWHWVVFWRGPRGPVVLDSKRSLRRHVRTDFGRMKPKWFMTCSIGRSG